jgi:hypothetical protein
MMTNDEDGSVSNSIKEADLDAFFDFFSKPLPRNIRNRNARFDKNVTKRGHVSTGKAAEHEDESHVSKTLIAFFFVVVVGSSVVQMFNMFSTASPP